MQCLSYAPIPYKKVLRKTKNEKPKTQNEKKGEAVELAPATVVVHRIEVLALDLPNAQLEIDCSSGTYIRALARDLGERLGVGAALWDLRRTRIGPHDVGIAIPAERLDDPDAVRAAWIAPADALAHLPRVPVNPGQAREIGHGGPVTAPAALPEDVPVVVVDGGEVIAIAEVVGGMLRPRKVFR